MIQGCFRAFFVTLFLISSSIVLGQVPEDMEPPEDRTVVVEVNDGKEYYGTLVSQNKEEVVIVLRSGAQIAIPADQVVNISYVKLGVDDPYYFNLQSARYFYSTNGYGLKKGEGYYQNSWVFLNQVSYGFTDRFSMGFGIIPLFLFGEETPFFVTPKFTTPVIKDALNVGVGGLLGATMSERPSTFGVVYGTVTGGNRDFNISVSLGYGIVNGEWERSPMVAVSGMKKLRKRFYLITENYIFPQFYVFSFGGRSIFKAGPSLDYGLFYPDGASIVWPWLGVTVPFTSR